MNDNNNAYRERLQRIASEAHAVELHPGADALLAVLELRRIADTLENIERILMRTFKA